MHPVLQKKKKKTWNLRPRAWDMNRFHNLRMTSSNHYQKMTDFFFFFFFHEYLDYVNVLNTNNK